jgi:hypothetical protein
MCRKSMALTRQKSCFSMDIIVFDIKKYCSPCSLCTVGDVCIQFSSRHYSFTYITAIILKFLTVFFRLCKFFWGIVKSPGTWEKTLWKLIQSSSYPIILFFLSHCLFVWAISKSPIVCIFVSCTKTFLI